MDKISPGEAVACGKCGRPLTRSTSNRNYGELKACTFCRQEKWRDANRDKIAADNKARYEADRDSALARAANWRANNLEKHRLNSWKTKLRAKGSSVAYYDSKLKEQGGACALCGRPQGKRRLDQDHEHKRKIPRGLLCGPCNRRVGWFEAIRAMIPKIESYLARYEKENESCTTLAL